MSDKKKILVIDDDKDIVIYLTTLMEDNGYDTVSAVDGVDGLAKVKAEKPDLILLDIMMPGLDGYEVAKRLKAEPRTKDIVIAMVSKRMRIWRWSSNGRL